MKLQMPIGEAFIDALMGWAVVFLGIVLLIIVVVLVGKLMVSVEKKSAAAAAIPATQPVPAAPVPAPAPKPQGPAAPGAAGDLKLYDTPERDAAMIMAIVADELKLPINELRFISIKEVHKK